MNAAEIQAFAKQDSDHMFNRILPFWNGPAPDREQSGWRV
ncbi:MAG: hypothetical protein BWX48_00787 [Verrucomicrobia bacterium ADurb.Bin006]|jgi:mannose/cellobiose epimerase-like protein (N-acyl-D-glucosamine 2-epimerase family)|nr:MAG: hypothetical protein BWX48_00787 [Verrucomicrobia bacterium ADurb.Bin006]